MVIEVLSSEPKVGDDSDRECLGFSGVARTWCTVAVDRHA